MPVAVNLSTTLREAVAGYQPERGLTVELGDVGSLLDLAGRLGLPLGEIKIVMLNGRRAELSAAVKDGDRVAFFPAVGGG